jgi:hypothetical protein
MRSCMAKRKQPGSYFEIFGGPDSAGLRSTGYNTGHGEAFQISAAY